MKKIFRLGLGRSKTGKILDRNTKWFISVNNLLNHIDKNPSDASKSIFVSVNGGAYRQTTIEKCRGEI